MDTIHLTSREAVLWVAGINAVIGFILGLIPLLFGYFYKQLKTGAAAILVTTVGGAILGVLISIPATIAFTWLISTRAKKLRNSALTTGEPPANEPN